MVRYTTQIKYVVFTISAKTTITKQLIILLKTALAAIKFIPNISLCHACIRCVANTNTTLDDDDARIQQLTQRVIVVFPGDRSIYSHTTREYRLVKDKNKSYTFHIIEANEMRLALEN